MALPDGKKSYTLADYLRWKERKGRYELIDGDAYLMAPPTRTHQRVCVELTRQLANFLEGKRCEVYAAPFGVRLFEREGDGPEDVDTLVEPDITVVCDKSKLDEYGCRGAPELVMEVLSPSSRKHDRLVKLNLYQRAGVPEYWIINPEEESVQVFLRDDSGNLRIHNEYDRTEIAKVHALDGCFIELCKVFPV